MNRCVSNRSVFTKQPRCYELKMFLKIITLFSLVIGIKGDVDYVFNDQADGWLKLYKTPALYDDAKIRCETEGAVLASPVVEKLRDAISTHVLRQGGVTAIYTGVHADFAQGDFYSREGVALANLPVQMYAGTPIDYRSSESCIVWDLVGYAFLRRAKCETKFPYVCYKKRTQSVLPAPAPQPQPITESGFGTRDSETNLDTQPNNKPSGQLPPDHQLSPQNRQPTSNQNPQQGTRPESNSQYPQTSHNTPPNPLPGTFQQNYHTLSENIPIQHSQIQGTYQTQFSQGNLQPQPDQNQLPKCSFDGVRNLLVLNSKDISTIMNYLADKPSVTVLFADSVYSAQNGSLWHVEVQNIGSPQPQPANTQSPPVERITRPSQPQHNEGNQYSTGSQRPFQVVTTSSTPTVAQGSQSYYTGPFYQTTPRYNPRPENNNNTGTHDNNQYTNVTDHQLHNEGNNFNASHGSPQDGTNSSQIPISPTQTSPSLNPTQTGYSSHLKKAGGRLNLHQQPESFAAASTRCASEGAVLASPLTTDLKDALTNYVLRTNAQITTFYTGIHANFSNGDYYSTEGVSLTKMPVSLNPGAPTTYSSSDSCITMSTNNDIVTSVKCTDRYPYVCFKQSKLVRGCGTQDLAYKYEQITQSCYKFHNIGKTWSEAYQTCNDEGGYLAILNSIEESQALKKLLSKYPMSKIMGFYKNSVYIGIRDWRDEKSWLTVKGESIQSTGYTGWAPTLPFNVTGRDCGTLARNGLLYNDPCTLNLAFICEKDSEILYEDDQDKP